MNIRALCCATAIGCFLLAGVSPDGVGSSAAFATEGAAVVDGFRSAKFGATAAQVKKAVTKDFGHKDDDIKVLRTEGVI